MVGKRVMVDAVVDFGVWIACTLCAEFPYRPVVAMFRVEEFDKRIEGVAVCALWICTTGSGSRDDCM
jgi:hypothetical protein